ncbi:tocopherol cyclase family protein [Streptomyces olivaceiscleroticus]|uniref:Tocopherol cyclase n=1 Tax=Streptomyces olivaceiscleroticus TaxID=68245 RepID=A0ABN0ZFW2_9ACTN
MARCGWWRRTGADLPWGDPLRSHQALMEGYLWRFTDPRRGRVLLVASGVNHHPGRPWGAVVIATSPGGLVRTVSADGAWDDPGGHRLRVPGALSFADGTLQVETGDGRVAAAITTAPARRTAVPGGGVFSLVPGLNHYWHPYLLSGRVEGMASVGGQDWDLTGCEVYAEKSWGRGFPALWWWGQAHAFDRPGVAVAFAGGLLGRGRLSSRVSGLVVELAGRRLRMFPPRAIVRGGVEGGAWRITAAAAHHRIALVGHRADAPGLRLPVPSLTPHRFGHSVQHLAGTARLEVVHRGKRVYTGVSSLASLETGRAPVGEGVAARGRA